MFPRFLGTIKELRLPVSVRPASVVPWSAVPRPCGSASSPAPGSAAGVGLRVGIPVPYRMSVVETTGSPRFLGCPCQRALLSDPGRASAPRHSRCLGAADIRKTTPALDDRTNFGAQSHGSLTRCLRFAAGSLQTRARLASGCGLGFAGQARCLLLGTVVRFQLADFLLTQALPGAPFTLSLLTQEKTDKVKAGQTKTKGRRGRRPKRRKPEDSLMRIK